MKYISLLAVLFAGAIPGISFCAEADEPARLDLDGHKVVVRLYSNWAMKPTQEYQKYLPFEKPEVFEKVSMGLKGTLGRFDLSELVIEKTSRPVVLLILPEDQHDPIVKQALRISFYDIFAPRYEPATKYSLLLTFPLYSDTRLADKWFTFKDAVGRPLAGATVHIFLADQKNSTKAKIKEVELDSQGRLKLPKIPQELQGFTFIVFHPDYGRAVVENIHRGSKNEIICPLTKIGTDADKRSIWGRVLDPNSKPVQGAVVICTRVTTPGGGSIDSAYYGTKVITDEQGRFAMNLPTKSKGPEVTSVPPVCKYRVHIRAPKVFDLMSFSGQVPNGRETTIVLEKPKYFRRFAFEDANGPITDVNILQHFSIRIEKQDGKKYSVLYLDFKDGKLLPLGTYSIYTYGGLLPEFESKKVTKDNPQELVFKVKQENETLYTGQVVHGITGEPMEGAFVNISRWNDGDFSMITPQQWQKLNALDSNPDIDDPALEPVQQIRLMYKIMRTDNQGRFQLEAIVRKKTDRRLVAFKQDYVAVEYFLRRKDLFKPDANNVVNLPSVRLYPAATVVFEPYLLKAHKCEVGARLSFDRSEQPDWAEYFIEHWKNRAIVKSHLKPNNIETLQIPAGLNLKIKLTVAQGNRRGGPWWCPVFTEMVNATQGQIVNLGKITIKDEMPIFVQVFDQNDNPVEGVGVTHMEAERELWFGQRHITDSDGFARFMVSPYYKGRFRVYCDRAGSNLKETIPYQTSGPADANNVYTLRVSDEMMEYLFE